MDQLDRLLTPQELSAYLEIPVATLYAWRYRGTGPTGFRVGRHLRYRRSDVAQWISQQLDGAFGSGSEKVTVPSAGGGGE